MTAHVTFLNPRTCGIYKSGNPRFKSDPKTGKRTPELDNQLLEFVDSYLAGIQTPGEARVPLGHVLRAGVAVPTYYVDRYQAGVRSLLKNLGTKGVSLGQLVDRDILLVREGHGSPANDQRSGTVPYIKVSDIRALRININPTNLAPLPVAESHWKGTKSGLQAWDLVTPNRASSNIGEFAPILPGEEQLVLTREVFVFRLTDQAPFDPFYLLWALTIKAVREQWRRIALMQTNREDCGDRYREIVIPKPRSKAWANRISQPFREYFGSVAKAKAKFSHELTESEIEFVASAKSGVIGRPEPAAEDA